MMASRNIPIIILGTIAIAIAISAEGMILYNGMLEASINTAKASVADKLQAAQTSLARSKAIIEAETAAVASKRQKAEANIAVQKAQIADEDAANAQRLETAKAAKASAESKVAAAIAVNEKERAKWEAWKLQQTAIIEKAKASQAARLQRAIADKNRYESDFQKQVADNAELKFKSEASSEDFESKFSEAGALTKLWVNNCANTVLQSNAPYWRIYNTFGKAYGLCRTIWSDYLTGPPYFMWPNYKYAP
jgi:hypothetical protein